MNAPLIWLHEEALRLSHPVFKAAPQGTRAIFVWDDGYVRRANYSFKRLVFIYETLCELSIEIIRGDTAAIIQQLAPSMLYVPATNNPFIVAMMDDVKAQVPVEIIEDEAFVTIKKPDELKRFFHYWNKAQKTAFTHNGGDNA